jgi:hypothetical protein
MKKKRMIHIYTGFLAIICIAIISLLYIKLRSNERTEYYGFSDYSLVIEGDSIEATESGWAYGLTDILKFKDVSYCAIGGTKLQDEINSDKRISKLPRKADIIICGGGTNDWGSNIKIGDLSTIKDTSTFAYAVNLMIDKLKEKYPDSIIMFVTPIFGISPDRHNFDDSTGIVNNAGGSLYDYGRCMLEICEYRNVKCFDLYEACNINESNYTDYLLSQENSYGDYTSVHPNEAGKKVLGSKIAGYMIDNILPMLN